MKRHITLILAAALLLAADWPRFRGPNGTGLAPDTKLPAFSPTQNVRWKVSAPPGNGSPIIVGNKVFLQSGSPSERSLLCLDLSSGKQLWKLDQPGEGGKIHKKNSLASSTPAADANCVVAALWDGASVQLIAADHAGKKLWARPLGSFASQHGAGMSPIVVGGRVFVNYDMDTSSHLLAFDAVSGSPLWSAERKPENACYSTPYLRESGELVVTSTTAVTAYDPATGKVKWEHPWDWSYTKDPLRTVGSSVEAIGVLFATGGNGGGNSHLLALEPNGSAKPKLLWERKNKGWPYVPCMLLKDGLLFTVSDKGFAGCYDARTGEQKYFERLFSDGVSASPIMIDGQILACSEGGVLALYPATPSFKSPTKIDFGDPIMATPAAADGRLVIRTKSHLYCIGAN